MPAEEEKIVATKSLLSFGILTMSVWVALGTAAVLLVSPVLGWLFLGFSAFSILIVIRRQMCSSCYYCQSCTKGFAKTSKLFLGGNHIPGIGRGTTVGMTSFIYALLTVIPVTLLLSSVLQQFSLLKVSVLVALLSVTAYNAAAHTRDLRR